MEMRFLFIVGSTLDNENLCEGVERVVEKVCKMGRPVPSPITMSLAPSYGLCREKLVKSEVT